MKTIDIGDSAVIYRDNMPDYCAPWSQEIVDILIKTVLRGFSGEARAKKQKRSENVKLLSFADIKDRIKKAT